MVVFSLGLMFLCGILMGKVFEKMKLPRLLGMLLTGIVLGPYALNLIDQNLLNISADLRQIALIIILMRAGLNLNIEDLKKAGRPAILMCFIPALFEIGAMVMIAPHLLGISYLDAAVLGSVIAAVSPAVVVPKMLKLMEEGYGTNKSIPQMIMAGASVDDVFVIVLFTSFTALAAGGNFAIQDLLKIPTSIFNGVAAGIVCGSITSKALKHSKLSSCYHVMILLSISFALVTIEKQFTGRIGFSGLLAIMSMGIMLTHEIPVRAKQLSASFSIAWELFEILLFILVGASVNLSYALKSGPVVFVLLGMVTMCRMLGVFICMLNTTLNKKERLFCMIAYTPKATVQAAIGSLPLAMGLGCGEIVLSTAVLAILFTAPIGAFLMDVTYKKWLIKK